MAQRDGYIGVRDFPGAVIRAYENEGWTFIGRAFVQKNPQSQAIRIKSKALLFVQLRKDSADSRPALIDQVLLFKKPGENAVPIMPVKNKELDNETWIEWAHGIWIGIRETETLQFGIARGVDDEKHICPLQLGTIERCIKLYSNPGEMVLTPFGGIGSEAYMAVKLGRKATLIELKQEYFNVAIENIKKAEASANVSDLFSLTGVEVA
jgi:DNA modification methylase